MDKISHDKNSEIAGLLAKIKPLLEEYYDKTCAQTEAIDKEDTAALDANIIGRRTLIEQIDLLYAGVSDFKPKPGSNGADTIEELFRSNADIMRKIQDKDRENETKIRGLMLGYSDRLKKSALNRKGINGYNQTLHSLAGDYIDKKQ